MIAALPMYDWPVLQRWNDRLWRLVRDRLLSDCHDAPDGLTRGGDYRDLWLDPGLFFAQTCGLPFNTLLDRKVGYLATPCYRTEGCEGATFSSAIVVNGQHGSRDLEEALAGGLTVNGRDSWSGFVALQRTAAQKGIGLPTASRISGGHLHSMQTIAEGAGGCAAIDAVALGLARLHLPDMAEKLEVIGWTDSAPATPFITGKTVPPGVRSAILRALREALASPEATAVRQATLLDSITVLPNDAYLEMRPLEAA